MEIKFSKWHGAGNDFVLIDEFEQEVVSEKQKPELARRICDRHLGIGADGVLFLQRTSNADARMAMYNPDGSGPTMCGNGIRCLAAYAHSNGYVPKTARIDSAGAGIKELRIEDNMVTVDMGTVSFGPEDIPVENPKEFVEQELEVLGRKFTATAASIGNPHLLIEAEELGEIDQELEKLGPALENHRIFPKRINVHFAKVLDRNRIRIITWERGAGRTLACGTGATTSVAILSRLGRVETPCRVQVPGGELEISRKGGNWLMKGEAVEVFRGTIEV